MNNEESLGEEAKQEVRRKHNFEVGASQRSYSDSSAGGEENKLPSPTCRIKRRKTIHFYDARVRTRSVDRLTKDQPRQPQSTQTDFLPLVPTPKYLSEQKAELSILLAVRELFPALNPSKCRDLCSCTATFLQTMGKYFVESNSSLVVTQCPQSNSSDVVTSLESTNASGERKKIGERRPAPLNIDKSIYFANPKYRSWCPICEKLFERIVLHYVNDHPESEVLVSRLSQRYFERAKAWPLSNVDKSYVKAVCYFCEEQKDLPFQRWLSHILGHTGERNIRCTGCKNKFSNHSKHSCTENSRMEILFDYKFCDGMLDAYVCLECNYVQTQKPSICQHIQSQHHIKNVSLGKHFRKIHLVTSK